MASDPSVIEALDALHLENDDLRAELAATVRDLAGVVAALEAERELVGVVGPSGPNTLEQIAETRRRIASRQARERAFADQVVALVANAAEVRKP